MHARTHAHVNYSRARTRISMHTLTYPLSFHYLFNDLCIRNSVAPRSSTLFSYFSPSVPGSQRERTSYRFSVPENERCTCARSSTWTRTLDNQKEDNMKKPERTLFCSNLPQFLLLLLHLLLVLVLVLFTSSRKRLKTRIVL